MTQPDEQDHPTPPDTPTAPSPLPPITVRWWHRWKLILAAVIVTPIVGFAVYTFVALTWSYSDGDRAGVLQKFSHRGWLCKTWEGELLQPTPPGVPPTIWTFTVRDDSVAQLVNGGIGKRVVLTYQEHRGVPTSCFGDTHYFVTGVRVEP